MLSSAQSCRKRSMRAELSPPLALEAVRQEDVMPERRFHLSSAEEMNWSMRLRPVDEVAELRFPAAERLRHVRDQP